MGPERLGRLVGLGPEGIMVACILAGLRWLFPFPLYVRQTIPADKFALGSRRLSYHHNYLVMGEPLPPFPRPAQLRNVKP